MAYYKLRDQIHGDQSKSKENNVQRSVAAKLSDVHIHRHLWALRNLGTFPTLLQVHYFACDQKHAGHGQHL